MMTFVARAAYLYMPCALFCFLLYASPPEPAESTTASQSHQQILAQSLFRISSASSFEKTLSFSIEERRIVLEGFRRFLLHATCVRSVNSSRNTPTCDAHFFYPRVILFKLFNFVFCERNHLRQSYFRPRSTCSNDLFIIRIERASR